MRVLLLIVLLGSSLFSFSQTQTLGQAAADAFIITRMAEKFHVQPRPVDDDFSKDMLAIAKEKITDNKVTFKQADITKKWTFGKAQLITCNLVLEHIENIDFIFQQAAKSLYKNGQFFICEYHSYRQLQGKGAKFEQNGKELLLEYFVHHISDYTEAAMRNGFIINDLREWFDDDDRTQIPRLASFLFQKK